MINLIQPITVQQAYDGITHARRWASWNWWWRMLDDDDGDDFPSPEPKTDSRSTLSRKNRAWWRLRIVKRDESFSLIFFLPEHEYMELELRSVEPQGAHEVGGRAPGGWARPPPSWTGCGPPGVDSFASIFYLFQKYSPWSFRSFQELLFLHKNNTMAILLKTTPVRVSSIQIMQVRVQNKGKSVWKSRYDGDISTPPSLNICLSPSNSVDKLKVIKKNFYKLCLILFALISLNRTQVFSQYYN